MEEKLARYRAAKQKLEESESQSGTSFLGKSKSYLASFASRSKSEGEIQGSQDVYFNKTDNDATSEGDATESMQMPSSETTSLLRNFLIVLWCFLLACLAYYGLAGPFIVLTAIIIMVYYGTSSGRVRKRTELSAYSVFNPNCVRLDGTFTAEQFENELLRRPLDSKSS